MIRRIELSILLFLFANEALSAPQGQDTPPPAIPKKVEAYSRKEGLDLIDGNLKRLRNAFANDPLADQVAKQKDLVDQELTALRELLSQLPSLDSPLESIPARERSQGRETAARRSATVRETLTNIGDKNAEWQMDNLDQVILRRRVKLLPKESLTIQAIKEIQPIIQEHLTGPLAGEQMEELGKEIGKLAKSWRSFFNNVTLQQYPWESLYNGWLDRKHALTDIPTWEFRAFHPVAGLTLYQHRTSSNNNQTLAGAELIGVQWFDAQNNYAPTWGLSALWTLRTQDQSSNGYGLLATYRNYKLGYSWSKGIDGRRSNQLILSINLAQFIQFKGNQGFKQAITNAEAYLADPKQ